MTSAPEMTSQLLFLRSLPTRSRRRPSIWACASRVPIDLLVAKLKAQATAVRTEWERDRARPGPGLGDRNVADALVRSPGELTIAYAAKALAHR